MKGVILKIYKKVGIKSDRTKNIANHVGLSFLFKGGSIIANFMLVPLTISYLDTTNYGIWLTLSSFIAWFSFFNLGLGHGLRNKLAEAKANGNSGLGRAYVSSAYYTIGIISLFIFSLTLILNYFIDWTKVFNTNPNLREELGLLMPLVFLFFCIQLITNLITSIFLATQNHSIQMRLQFFVQVLSLFMVWILIETTKSSILIYGTLFSFIPVLILLFFNVYAFSDKFKNLKPTILLCKKKYIKEILGLGLEFFVIQISILILFSTDNIIISNLFTPKEVVPYNIAYKYFTVLMILFGVIAEPYWSTFTEAYAKKDIIWIKKSISYILKIWAFTVPITLLIMILFANRFYEFWVGEKIVIPMVLSLYMALLVFLFTFQMIFTNFINGVGKLKLQMITAVISIIINVPLSILFSKTLNFGTYGVVLATCVSILIYSILRPIQYYKIITNKAKGIWNK